MAVSTRAGHTLTLLEDGSLCVFGDNGSGQLGIGTKIKHEAPIVLSTADVFAGEKMVMVATGYWHSACVSEVGAVWTWGKHDKGQLGRGTARAAGHEDFDQTTPGRIDPSSFGHSPAVMVVCGNFFTMILTDAGHVWSCGCNHFGSLGLGHVDQAHIPTQINPAHFGGIPIGVIAAGDFHAMAIDREGRAMWAWGINEHGVLGLGQSINQPQYNHPMCIPAGAFDGVQIASIATGNRASTVVTVEGTLWVCGQVPHVHSVDGGVEVRSHAYTRVGGAEVFGEGGVRMVSGGGLHSFIVAKDGSMWRCGSTHYHQHLTRIDMSHFRNPRIVAAASGGGVAIAVSAQGRVFTWGLYGGKGVGPYDRHGVSTEHIRIPCRLRIHRFNGKRVGRWYRVPADITLAFVLGRHAHFAAEGGRTAYSDDDMPEELLISLFESMRFRPRAIASQAVNLLLGMDLE